MDDPAQRPLYAVIDVGSKSVRLLVARRLSASAFEVVDEERYDSRLGEGQGPSGLAPEAMERGLRAMKVVTQVARSYNPLAIVAVGTEALRRAPNSEEFIQLVESATGARIRVLEAGEEAYASFLGTVNSTGMQSGCLVDLGGGSLEVMEVRDRSLQAVNSLPLGAIYATERYFTSDPPTARDVRALRKAVHQHLEAVPASRVVYGAGGAMRNIARMIRARQRYPLRRLHGFAVERKDVRRLARDLLAAPPAERRKLPGLNADRVATLPAAAVVVEEVMRAVDARRLVLSGQAMREGILWQEIRGESPIVPDVRTASVAGLASANSVDVAEAEPEAASAAHLFDATCDIHRYGEEERDLLLHAARLAEIGMHVDYYNRDRHAEYLVHSGDLHGFSHREIVLLAAMVRWSMSGTTDLSSYAGLTAPGDKRRVVVLAAILGVARAVWRRTPSPVQGIEVRRSRKRLTITIVATGPADAEQYAVERQARRLSSALKVDVTVVTRESS